MRITLPHLEPPMPSPLSAHLGFWLRYVSNHVSHTFARRLERFGITVAEWVFLRELYDHDQLAPAHLAAAMGMTRGAISKLSDRLLSKALISREDDPSDRRSHRLSLTADGRALVPLLAAEADENDRAFFAHLDPATRQALEHTLRGLVTTLQLTPPPVE